MGTGSHRPQWEAAKGRPDIAGGIKHARALRSHTKLKFRQKQDHSVRLQIANSDSNKTGSVDRATKTDTDKEDLEDKEDVIDLPSTADKPDVTEDLNPSDSDRSDDSDSEEEMAAELERLQKAPPKRSRASWRSESAFSSRAAKPSKEDPFLRKYIR